MPESKTTETTAPETTAPEKAAPKARTTRKKAAPKKEKAEEKDLCPWRPGGGIYQVTTNGAQFIGVLGPARRRNGRDQARFDSFDQGVTLETPKSLKAAGWIWVSGGVDLS